MMKRRVINTLLSQVGWKDHSAHTNELYEEKVAAKP